MSALFILYNNNKNVVFRFHCGTMNTSKEIVFTGETMKNAITLSIVASVLFVSACSSTPTDNSQQRFEQIQRDAQEANQALEREFN
tara:strand:+ start:2703 stop:2960 length:258 start_codon:yes stop_codon:yes gene_type:complete